MNVLYILVGRNRNDICLLAGRWKKCSRYLQSLFSSFCLAQEMFLSVGQDMDIKWERKDLLDDATDMEWMLGKESQQNKERLLSLSSSSWFANICTTWSFSTKWIILVFPFVPFLPPVLFSPMGTPHATKSVHITKKDGMNEEFLFCTAARRPFFPNHQIEIDPTHQGDKGYWGVWGINGTRIKWIEWRSLRPRKVVK